MSVDKLTADAREHVTRIVTRRKVGNRDLDDESLSVYQLLLDSADIWREALSDPVLLEFYLGFHLDRYRSRYRHYLYQNCLYGVSGKFTSEQEKLLVQDAFDSERRKFERLKQKFAAAAAADSRPSRPAISENVRIAVWRRDGGKCARCGSRERLEYDHIIPIALGGSNTARNIELLCEACNRAKGADIC